MQQPTQQQNSGSGAAGSELRSDARQLGSKAADRLHSEVDSRKGEAANQAKSVSNAIQSAAGQLDEGAPSWLKSTFQQGADQIQRFADTIEQKDSREILSDVQGFARERPALFLGACAAAGFAAARIFKAGAEPQGSRQFSGQSGQSSQSQPWGSGEQDFGQSDNFGQQFDEGRPFVAAGQSGSQQSGQPSGLAADEPLILGSDETGTRSPRQGEYL